MPDSRKTLLPAVALLMSCVFCAAAERKATPEETQKSSTARDRHKFLVREPLVIGYYVEDSRALRSVEENTGLITLLAPQSFTLEADGVVRGSIPPPLAAFAERKRLPVMPLVVNPGFDRKIATTILRSPKLQERTASYLAYLARRGNFAGWQLDLEHIDPADKAHYSSFVRRVAAKLHRDGRILSVAVTPRFSDSFPDNRDAPYRTGEWGVPFDYRALAATADFIVLMAYDQHTSATPPGPIAGYDWVRAALEFATSQIPAHKLVLGLPVYGREWVETPFGRISRSMNYESLTSLLERPDIVAQWNEMWRTPWVQYREDPDTHTVWFENRRSIEEKLDLARQYRLRGIAAWRLGLEHPDFWAATAEWSSFKSTRVKQGGGKPRKPTHASGGSSE